MSKPTRIPALPADAAGVSRFRISAREPRAFSTVLDARTLLAKSAFHESTVAIRHDGEELVLESKHPTLGGHVQEEVRFANGPDGLATKSLSRRVTLDVDGTTREERATTFDEAKTGLPHATYPEVTLPFLAGRLPFDGKARSVYAWINDRFVAKVYLESQKRQELAIGGKKRLAQHVIMYPDLNDWVRLGPVITSLAKPFIPKYHMWFLPEPPFALLRFEGPYGPPGAPEIVLERID